MPPQKQGIRDQVQPRVCGEYATKAVGTYRDAGSTPRMRGICCWTKQNIARLRFNPAYAGNIRRLCFEQVNQQVQPRVCGEYLYIVNSSNHGEGSTPRMRGIYCNFFETQKHSRFNPAYAGNIDKQQSFQVRFQVQPRVCGEYVRILCGLNEAIGSTPRMRGILKITLSWICACRFNPAYAGNILLDKTKYGAS